LVDVQEVAITIALSGFIPERQRECLKKQLDSHINSLQITILSAESYKIGSMISNGEVDIAVIPAINSRMNYPVELKSRRTWFKSRLHIYCSKEHPLSQLSEISEDDVKSYRRIRLVTGMVNNQSPRNNIYTDNVVSAYRLCAQGLGWCELPEWFVESQHRQGDTRLKMLAVSPIWQTLEFDAIFRNEPKGKFMNWFIGMVTGKEPLNV
jgi:DNA-binding transcriptional LysR family regulator